MYNGGIESWNGIGFRNKFDNMARFVHDTRSGDTRVVGSMSIEKNICVGEGDNQACFDQKELQKYKRDIKDENPTFNKVGMDGIAVNGGAIIINNGSKNGVTHFNYNNTGVNYIRGGTEVSNNLNIKGKLCIGKTCIDEQRLKLLSRSELPADIDRVNGWSGGAVESPGDKYQTAESCRKQAWASNGKYAAWGFRTDNHPNPDLRNTCFLYTAPFAPFKGNAGDTAHMTGCLRPGEKVEYGCKEKPDKVDCKVSSWSDWGACTKTCGGGTQTRTRTVTENAAYGGAECPALTETQACNTQACPADCKVGDWSAWGECSKPCGTGSQTRTRSVTQQAANGGAICPSLSEMQNCNTQACPIDCQVGEWTAWSACDKSCGGGKQTRTRLITKPAENGGKPCPALTETQDCNTQACPVDCKVSEWSAWSACDKTCGGGTQTRTRTVTRAAANGGKECPLLTETQACNTQTCPVDCKVSEWSAWSACDKTCGGGTQTRTRSVTVPAANNGKDCPVLTETQVCNSEKCYNIEIRSVNLNFYPPSISARNDFWTGQGDLILARSLIWASKNTTTGNLRVYFIHNTVYNEWIADVKNKISSYIRNVFPNIVLSIYTDAAGAPNINTLTIKNYDVALVSSDKFPPDNWGAQLNSFAENGGGIVLSAFANMQPISGFNYSKYSPIPVPSTYQLLGNKSVSIIGNHFITQGLSSFSSGSGGFACLKQKLNSGATSIATYTDGTTLIAIQTFGITANSCYGARIDDCYTCEHVIKAYQDRGWAYNKLDFIQCR
jgi:hypothetical protein